MSECSKFFNFFNFLFSNNLIFESKSAKGVKKKKEESLKSLACWGKFNILKLQIKSTLIIYRWQNNNNNSKELYN